MKKNVIYNQCCIGFMNTKSEYHEQVDLVLTSPPYNTTTRKGRTDPLNNRYATFNEDNKTDEEYIQWTIDVFKGYEKILKPNGVVLYNLSYSSEKPSLMWQLISRVMDGTEFMIADTIVWKKSMALPNNVSHNKLTRICEFIFVFVRKTERDTFFMNKNVVSVNTKTKQSFYSNEFNYIQAKNNDGSNPLNKATFSTELVTHLLKLYAKKGFLVYDSFMGIGTTAKGCTSLGIDWIGTELSIEQIDFFNSQMIQISLF